MFAHAQLAHPSSDRCSYPAGSPIKVVLADDHRVVGRSLRLALENEPDLKLVAEAGDLLAVGREVNGHVPDVLLLDLRMAKESSTELIRRVRSEVPETEIVVVTMEDSPAFAREAIDAGAIGYVLKDHAHSELAIAIRRAGRGEEYVSPRVAAGLRVLRQAAGEDGLNERETEIVRLIALGYTSREIASTLWLSPRTVATHVAQLHSKLGLARRWELVQYALARHLMGPEPGVARANGA